MMSASASELAHRYAPVVRLHAEEPYAPMSADAFVERSALVWREPDERHVVLAGGKGGAAIDVGWLGRDALPRREQCPYRSPDGRFIPPDFTRPFDGGAPRGPEGAALDEAAGFALMPRAGEAIGKVTGREGLLSAIRTAEVTWELQRREARGSRRVASMVLCYWLFFGASTYPLGLRSPEALARWILRRILGQTRGPVTGPQAPPATRDLLDPEDLERLWREQVMHQGDWEGISIMLSAGGEPISVHFRAHGLGRSPIEADRVEWTGDGRPVVRCAKGSHGCYDAPGSAEVPDLVPGADAIEWDTRLGGLANARAKGWFGFGGAWGEPDLDRGPLSLSWERDELTGPLGPSRYKAIWPQ
jgi:hypothetical protein